MLTTQLESSFFNRIKTALFRPNRVMEAAILSKIQAVEGCAYPGELRWPRRMDGQFVLPRRARRHFKLNIEINRGDSYNEMKRSRMLDPHLVERCDRVYGHGNYLNVLIVGTDAKPTSQRYQELSRYFTPNREFNLLVIPCSSQLDAADARKVGDVLRNLSRTVMGLE
jgi:hypothetical protein